MILAQHQIDAIKKMKNGCILNGRVGSGKSRTALGYYYLKQGGEILEDDIIPMKNPKDLYIITTAKKRDDLEWVPEMNEFLIDSNYYENERIIDSWNNIQKYAEIKGAFFIFDEDRVTGDGKWVEAFLKIARNNEWIILSATPGDVWTDYIPVFLANGFYRNKTEFMREHVVMNRFCKYPKVDRYLNTRRLERLRNSILIDMDFEAITVPHHIDIPVGYNPLEYKVLVKTRWNPDLNEPMQNAAELCYLLRKEVNSDPSRQVALLEIAEKTPRLIVFYNFDYELDILKSLDYGREIAEWNGHKHQPVPLEKKEWVYLVQYTAGCEGWNCVQTNTIVFYSQTYSYKTLAQACGRIDRMNTPYKDLYYYHFKSKAPIDLAIGRALKEKKKFNERKFTSWSE